MTLRESLRAADLDKVFILINKKDNEAILVTNSHPIKQTIDIYSKVVKELLGKPHVCAYEFSFLVQETEDWFDKKKYSDVCFLNPKYIAPKKGLKPWGASKDKTKIPKGYYNCNDNKYSRTFSVGWASWSEIIDTPIINDAKYSLDRMVSEILWEMTFYGWSEKAVNDSITDINSKMKIAMKESKEGKCIKLLPKKKDGFTIIIPDSVSKQIIAIAGKDNDFFL